MICKLSFILWIAFYSVDSGLWRHDLHFSHSGQFVYCLVVVACAFGVISKKWLPNPVLSTFAQCFLPRVKTCSRSLICFELILHIVLGRGPTLFFGRWTFRVFFSTLCWQHQLSPIEWSWHPCWKPLTKYVCARLVVQSCLTPCEPMDCSPPGSSVHGISQARMLKWVPIFFSRGSFWPRDRTWVSWVADGFFIVGATREDHIRGFNSTCFILVYWCTYLCLCHYHTFDYCSFVGSLGIRKCESSSFVLFEDYLGYLGSLESPYVRIFLFLQKGHGDFDRDCIDSVD